MSLDGISALEGVQIFFSWC